MRKEKLPKTKETPAEMVRSFLFAILIALVFRSLAYEPFHIPSGSMLSTLYKGDYVFVSKFSYGYSRFSFPFGFKFFDGRLLASAPKRGDVVVFRLPTNTHIDYIKRIIGMPGDTVQMKHSRLYINGELVEQTRRGEVLVPSITGEEKLVPLFEETLPGGVTHITLDQTPDGNLDNTPEFVVPEGHYFMMGDNRDDSADSRYVAPDGTVTVGFVPFENFIGRADVIAFSLTGRGGRWFKAIR